MRFLARLLAGSLAGVLMACSGSEQPTPPTTVSVDVPARAALAVKVMGTSALVTWRNPLLGPPLTRLEIVLDRVTFRGLPPTASSHRFTGLKPGTDHVVELFAVAGSSRSETVKAPFSVPANATAPPRPRATASAAAPTERPRAAAPAPRPAPKGRVSVVRHERVPATRQAPTYCDRLRVTVKNDSDTAVTSVTVVFTTYHYENTEPPPPAERGRNVELKQKVSMAPAAQRTLTFDVCLAEKKNSRVFAEPIGTRWVWARG